MNIKKFKKTFKYEEIKSFREKALIQNDFEVLLRIYDDPEVAFFTFKSWLINTGCPDSIFDYLNHLEVFLQLSANTKQRENIIYRELFSFITLLFPFLDLDYYSEVK